MTASRMKIVTLGLMSILSSRAPFAFGQGGQDGSIVGYVMDQTGSPIKGLKVIATSPTQIGGAGTAYTNEEGAFRLRPLFPGTFEIRVSAPKLKTVIQREILPAARCSAIATAGTRPSWTCRRRTGPSGTTRASPWR